LSTVSSVLEYCTSFAVTLAPSVVVRVSDWMKACFIPPVTSMFCAVYWLPAGSSSWTLPTQVRLPVFCS